MPAITIPKIKKTFEFEPGKSLLELLLDAGINIENPCNGTGICGKCKIRVLNGNNDNITATESELLDKHETEAGIRLACQLFPNGDLNIDIPQSEDTHSILVDGYIPDFDKSPCIITRTVLLQATNSENGISLEKQLEYQLPDTFIPFDMIVPRQLREGSFTAVIHEMTDGSRLLVSIEPTDTPIHIYGVAIDIGTTTVAASLIDMTTGNELSTSSAINPQKDYGTDVLTRIAYEIEHPDNGMEALQKTIVGAVNDMIENMCRASSVMKEHIIEITVAANCTMLHMLLGTDATPIGRAPYTPVFTESKDIYASDIGIHVAKGARLYCLPSVSSFIGADIVAGAYVCGLHETDESVFFIDIGTNGEMVFSDHGKMLSCSCAAGPALEGMNISSGMRAANGAIEDIRISENNIELQVIGGKAPAGICGSGILAAVKELLHAGLLRREGAFIDPEGLPDNDFRKSILRKENRRKRFILQTYPTAITITQKDIRQIQLAKGAILSGFYAVMEKTGRDISGLDKIIIAGQFGSHLPPDNITGTGLLPGEVKDKITYVGNTSKSGAYMALLSITARREMESLAQHMDYLELSTTENYQQLFADCMAFPV